MQCRPQPWGTQEQRKLVQQSQLGGSQVLGAQTCLALVYMGQ